MTVLETQVRNIFPDDFENAATDDAAGDGERLRQDLIAYWTGTATSTPRVLWHQRPEGEVVSINMLFNSDPDVLIPLF
jgi:hypothetical protein